MSNRATRVSAIGSALAWVLVALLLPACSPPEGSERAACYPNSTCNDGLVCLSNLCVRRVADGGIGSDVATGSDTPAPSDGGTPMDTGTSTDTGTLVVDSGRPDAGMVDAGPPPPPTFTGDIIPLFNRSCGSNDAACHARNVYNANSSFGCAGWLSLANLPLGATYNSGPNSGRPTGCPDKTLYERLTGSACQECSRVPMPIVAPGNADGSYLYRKIGTGPYCPFPFETMPSARMPMGGSLPAADIEMVRRWIAAGAPQT